MNIKVLGTKGCKNCEDLYEKITKLVDNKENINIERVYSIVQISSYNLKQLPGLVVDDKLVLEGIVPSNKDLENIIKTGKITNDIVNEARCENGNCRF